MSVSTLNSQFVWLRDEALASVAHLTLVDAPCADSDTDASAPVPVYDAFEQQDCSSPVRMPRHTVLDIHLKCLCLTMPKNDYSGVTATDVASSIWCFPMLSVSTTAAPHVR